MLLKAMYAKGTFGAINRKTFDVRSEGTVWTYVCTVPTVLTDLAGTPDSLHCHVWFQIQATI